MRHKLQETSPQVFQCLRGVFAVSTSSRQEEEASSLLYVFLSVCHSFVLLLSQFLGGKMSETFPLEKIVKIKKEIRDAFLFLKVFGGPLMAF